MDTLIDKLRQGDRRALARAMSLIDEGKRAAHQLKDWLRGRTGDVPWWGLTGPPGVGKSTLINVLLSKLRDRGRRVGVVAVDPTSPMSGGALLGDRVRMMRHAADRDVFIRSLATHGCEGGLSGATLHCARLLELAGYDPVVIETVGVGQNEADIASVADICAVLLGPGYGDDIQLIKAGLLEIADIVVVNKCDLHEARRLLNEIREELTPLTVRSAGRVDPETAGNPDALRGNVRTPAEIIGIEARSGRGVDDLLEKLLEADSAARDPERRERQKRRRALGEIRRSVLLTCEQALEHRLSGPLAEELITKLVRGEVTLDEVVNRQFAVIGKEPAAGRPSTTDN